MHAYSLLSTRRRQGTAVEKTRRVPGSEEQETRRVQPTCEHAENTDRDRLASPSPCNMDSTYIRFLALEDGFIILPLAGCRRLLFGRRGYQRHLAGRHHHGRQFPLTTA